MPPSDSDSSNHSSIANESDYGSDVEELMAVAKDRVPAKKRPLINNTVFIRIN